MSPEDAVHLPALVANLRILVRALAECIPGLRYVVLFGSAARLELGPESDVDVMVLIEPPVGGSYLDWLNDVCRTLVDVWYDAEDTHWWPNSYTEDATASGSDPGFLENVGRDGVVLYSRPGAHAPPFLARCLTFDEWADRALRLAAAANVQPEPVVQ